MVPRTIFSVDPDIRAASTLEGRFYSFRSSVGNDEMGLAFGVDELYLI